MKLSLSEIKSRAIAFANEWKDTSSEDAEAQSFLNAFFEVFGVSRRRVATFEQQVKKLDGKDGYIDLIWKGVLLVEQKSKGKSLDKAYIQATDYFPNLKDEELPSHILVCDFEQFRLYDLENNQQYDFNIKELHKKIHLFDFLIGFKKKEYKEEDPVNIKAAELLGDLHDTLLDNGYTGHQLEVFLVRVLFCLFADDTGIFQPRDHFTWFIENITKEDGSDTGSQLSFLFQLLNTHEDSRQKNLDDDLQKFPYINGELYSESLQVPIFDSKMRGVLLKCCHFDWSRISPAIFGSLFQSVMDRGKRRELGAHYTSEKNIMKVVSGLFLDDLKTRFEKNKNNPRGLKQLHEEISKLKFLDPACGCGNFLVITYRELRLLELEILKILQGQQQVTNINQLSLLNVDQFYGIEIEEWPARIAEVAMWLMDHQMNILLSEAFGDYALRIPLKKSPHIVHANALQIDWATLSTGSYLKVYAENLNYRVLEEPASKYISLDVVTKKATKIEKDEPFPERKTSEQINYDYILGNPPFVGYSLQNPEQKKDMNLVFHGIEGAGVLDYVSAWYIKAAKYILNTKAKVAFVSTNSITQGEQPGILWNILFNKYNVKIHFAHRTFKWTNEARGKAAVYCVIIGFANFDTDRKLLYEYENVKSEPHEIIAKNINPYLVNYSDLLIPKRSKPLCDVMEMIKGSASTDDGNFIFNESEKRDFLKNEPDAKKFFRRYIGSRDFLHNEKRWCLWLKDIKPNELKSLPGVYERVKSVRDFRLKSKKEATVKWAQYPTLFTEDRQPDSDYVVIPRVSSENRTYVPMGFLSKENILSDACIALPNSTFFEFGIITSLMHMSWMRAVCGRLKSDYRYSNTLVYNNFPWPQQVPTQKIRGVEEKAKKVLTIREQFSNSSLADLYDPLKMPPTLIKAHDELDKAVDNCYTTKSFTTELSRLEFLFDLYRKYTEPLLVAEKKKRGK